MSIIRNAERPKFTIVSRDTLRDPGLSWAAKGLLATMLSFPDDWDYNIAHLMKHATNGRDATRSALQELIDAGYVEREKQTRNEDGTLSSAAYVVRETSVGKPDDGESNTTKYVTSTKNERAYKHRAASGNPQKPAGSSSMPSSSSPPTVPPSASPPPRSARPPSQEPGPKNVKPETWDAFVEHRRQLKKKLTPVAAKRLRQKLESKPDLVAEAMLWKTVENGWTGVFELSPREVQDLLSSPTDSAARRQQMDAERERQREETLRLSEMPYE